VSIVALSGDEPIAVRELVCVDETGHRANVEVAIFKPEQIGNDFVCRYCINWPSNSSSGQAYGTDSVQALVLCLQKLGTDLLCSEWGKAGRLGWFEPGEGLGFPVPNGIRDLLQGFDKQSL
jgi:hypothetical protein